MMRITEALLGEHGAMYPTLDLIEQTTRFAHLDELKTRVACLRSALSSHARIEDELLKPAIEVWLPPPALTADGAAAPPDHEIIDSGLTKVLAATEVEDARESLLDTLATTRAHFLKEETIIFGIATRELSEELQERLGTEWARRRGITLK